MDVQLLCEGVCNGFALRGFDEYVAGAGRLEITVGPDEALVGCSAIDARELRALLDGMVYTAHQAMSFTIFRCRVCGQSRRWGKIGTHQVSEADLNRSIAPQLMVGVCLTCGNIGADCVCQEVRA